MCGIAGFIGTQPLPEARVKACLQALHHRGPDYAAFRAWQTKAGAHVALLHARLSIIDLDPRAHQPFQAGQKWLAHNGEIYNYVELRAALEQEGLVFATTSDTEVLLRALDRWGWEALERCEGMWAFALFDAQAGTLTLCRDRFGEKPLYVYRDGTGLYFGSEPKAIAALLGRPLRVNMAHVYRFLVNGYKALYKTRETFFEGLEELPPASWLRLEAPDRATPGCYWQPPVAQDEAMSFEEAVAGTRARLIQAVGRRLRAEVPLAFCMSGGVDSNALISIAKREFGYDVHGFTIANADARYEEQAMVQCAVEALGIRHTQIPMPREEFLPALHALVRQHDSPVATISYYAHWRLMRSISQQGYRIAVSGTGADEIFTGYYDHHLAYLRQMAAEPVTHAAAREAWQQHVRPWVRNPHLQNAERFIEDPAFRAHIFPEAETFGGHLTAPWAEPFAETPYTEDLLRNRMLNELRHEVVPVILHEDDLNAMAFSIENRSPFLDRDLVEFAAGIPTRHLIRDGAAKAVLREALAGVMPEPVRTNRRKVGFNAPIAACLDPRDAAVQRAILADSPIYAHVRREAIARLLAGGAAGEVESKFLFAFLSSKCFLEAFAG